MITVTLAPNKRWSNSTIVRCLHVGYPSLSVSVSKKRKKIQTGSGIIRIGLSCLNTPKTPQPLGISLPFPFLIADRQIRYEVLAR